MNKKYFSCFAYLKLVQAGSWLPSFFPFGGADFSMTPPAPPMLHGMFQTTQDEENKALMDSLSREARESLGYKSKENSTSHYVSPAFGNRQRQSNTFTMSFADRDPVELSASPKSSPVNIELPTMPAENLVPLERPSQPQTSPSSVEKIIPFVESAQHSPALSAVVSDEALVEDVVSFVENPQVVPAPSNVETTEAVPVDVLPAEHVQLPPQEMLQPVETFQIQSDADHSFFVNPYVVTDYLPQLSTIDQMSVASSPGGDYNPGSLTETQFIGDMPQSFFINPPELTNPLVSFFNLLSQMLTAILSGEFIRLVIDRLKEFASVLAELISKFGDALKHIATLLIAQFGIGMAVVIIIGTLVAIGLFIGFLVFSTGFLYTTKKAISGVKSRIGQILDSKEGKDNDVLFIDDESAWRNHKPILIGSGGAPIKNGTRRIPYSDFDNESVISIGNSTFGDSNALGKRKKLSSFVPGSPIEIY